MKLIESKSSREEYPVLSGFYITTSYLSCQAIGTGTNLRGTLFLGLSISNGICQLIFDTYGFLCLLAFMKSDLSFVSVLRIFCFTNKLRLSFDKAWWAVISIA